MGINVFPLPSSGKTVKGQSFTSNGNWTAPAGVNYVTVFALGGGGASSGAGSTFNQSNNYNGSNAGGDSTFGTNLVIARGGVQAGIGSGASSSVDFAGNGVSAPANSGKKGMTVNGNTGVNQTISAADGGASDGTQIKATVQVTPNTNYAVAVGAGGSIGNYNGNSGFKTMAAGAGGSGFVSLTWEE
jgi:hypothetical protein